MPAPPNAAPIIGKESREFVRAQQLAVDDPSFRSESILDEWAGMHGRNEAALEQITDWIMDRSIDLAGMIGWARQSGLVLAAIGTAAASVLGSPARAQSDTMVSLPAPAQQNSIVLGTGLLPGANNQESWYRQYGKAFVRNVAVATLTPFLPDPSQASGTAVIVAPGGGFRSLSMENEGSDVARALAAKGVAAFVLKYRLVPTPPDLNAFRQSMAAMFAGAGRSPRPSPADAAAALAPQLADARAAFALVRSHSAQWRIDPSRVGMIGFSAGAMLTLQTVLRAPEVKPAFIGIIYGPLEPVSVPADAPPMFVALAADDPIFGGRGMGLVQSWMTAKRPVEFHLYEQGGHGFGMYPKTTTSTGWFGAFVSWLGMHGLVKREL